MYQIDFNNPVHIHFIGIGGISMSGLAEILLSEGFTVSGSDNSASALTDKLKADGAVITIGQRPENITGDIDLVVYTAAIHPDNPEYAAAAAAGLPMLSRAQLLGQIMKNYRTPICVAGTHGKTTTTSMISEILIAAGLDPTLSVGGMLKSIGGNLRIGHGDCFVAEACEYTNSFHSFFPKYAIILNVEEDHMDFFHDISEIRSSFRTFAGLLPADGALILNGGIDHAEEITKDLACPVITFGTDEHCDYYPEDISYDGSGRAAYTLCHGEERFRVELGVVGEHNVLNSLSAIALSDILGVSRDRMLGALKTFTGTDRRFEVKGRLGGITVLDDYAHHPTEIRATLKAAGNYPHRELWCVFQPHTYSRTRAFLPEFAEALSAADHVLLAPIYAARETDHLGVSSDDIAVLLAQKGCDAHSFAYFDDIETHLLEHAQEGDLILTMGAGDVWQIGEKLLGIR